ncbi:MAG: CHAT domain-containing protein [Leptolyngbya sp. SIO1E4]|nr:CHAT domain-containing protein [Leptolyngbya sp. SIO1E4]
MLLKCLWLSSALSLATVVLGSPSLAAARPPFSPKPFLSAAPLAQRPEPEDDLILQVSDRLTPGDDTLQDGSLYDTHTVNADAGQTLTIRLESADFDTYLLLLDDQGNTLAENDDTDAEDLNATITYTTGYSGSYTVIANAYDASGQGQYQLTVRIVSPHHGSTPDRTADQHYADAVRLWQQGQLQPAFNTLELALAQYQAAENTSEVAKVNQGLGIVSHDLGHYDRAIGYLETSLALFQAAGDLGGEADALSGLGLVNLSRGQYEAAESYAQQALPLYREVNDLAGEAIELDHLGQIAGYRGEYDTALTYLEQGLALRRQLGNLRDIARSLNNLASIRTFQGRYELALTHYDEALATIEPLGDMASQATVLTNIGVIYGYQGQYPQALDYHQQSLALARETESVSAEGQALNNLGLAYTLLGQYDKSLMHFEQALAIARDLDDRAGESIYLGNIASVYDEQGHKTQAISLLEASLKMRQDIGDRAGEGETLNNLGTLYDDLGDYDSALRYYTDSLAISREIGSRYTEGRTLSNMGVTYTHQNQYDQALSFFQQALEIFAETGDRVAAANARRRIGELQYQSGQLPEATATLADTVNQLEEIRAAELPDAEQVALFETQRAAYMTYQAVLIAQNEIEAALEISEQGRARAFAERLAANVPNPTAAAARAESPSIEEIRAMARSQQATFVEYALIQPNPKDEAQLFIWVVQPTGDVDFRAQPLASAAQSGDPSETALTTLVNQLRHSVGVGNRGLGVVTASAAGQGNSYQALYTQLITPIADLLPTDPDAPVVFIPQDLLFQVPFAALQRADNTYLIEQHTILTAPSIQVWGLTQQAAQTARGGRFDNALVVGNPVMPTVWSPQQETPHPLPALPGAQQEALDIATLLGTHAVLGAEATEQSVKQALPSAQLVHLATHGLLEYGNVEDSGIRDLPGAIALAPGNGEDGLLTAAEILELPWTADLVVLSACDTGRGHITGDGVMGLSRSLMTKGVPSVVVSLWSVPDAPTAALMAEFYRQLTTGQNKAQALRQAMLATLQQHPHPRDWAAFTLLGSPE